MLDKIRECLHVKRSLDCTTDVVLLKWDIQAKSSLRHVFFLSRTEQVLLPDLIKSCPALVVLLFFVVQQLRSIKESLYI